MQYQLLAKLYGELGSTTKRLEKTKILSDFLKTVPEEELQHVLLLVQGRVFPQWDQREIGIAARLMLKAITIATGISSEEIEKHWTDSGDLGETARQTIKRKQQATLFSQELNTEKVFDNLQKLATLEGQGTVDRKVKLLAELLTSASPEEAKYIVRTALADLRIGLGEGTLRDAITWSCFGDDIGITDSIPDEKREQYNEVISIVQNSIDIANDFAKVAVIARTKGLLGLSNVELQPKIPVKVMLYQKAKDFEDAFSTVGKPAALEYKYDGFRMQIHKTAGKITIFTRSLEDVTAQFPEVVNAIKENISADNFILDAEAVGYDVKTGKYLPFQNISQRIKRKYDIAQMAKQFPVELAIFDVLFLKGKNLLQESFEQRRKLIEENVKQEDKKIIWAKQVITDNADEAQKFYEEALNLGNEGIMIKNLQGIYKPGSRVGYGVKIKPVMETLDVVIVGAEWGEGKRSQWLSSYVIAVKDESGELVEIGRVGTGFKEKDEEGVSFNQITELLKPDIINQEGKEVTVKPKIVLEINYEEIQASPTYSSGFALRFPRFVRLREDRGADEVSNISEVKELYDKQRGRNIKS